MDSISVIDRQQILSCEKIKPSLSTEAGGFSFGSALILAPQSGAQNKEILSFNQGSLI